MDSLSAFAMGEAARRADSQLMVFDWDQAAQIIKDRKPHEAFAGLADDWEWTGGIIYEKGEPIKGACTYLASTWATPQLDIDGEIISCWKYQKETPGWDHDTKWPDSSLKILQG